MCVACSIVGCAPGATGAFDDKGYQHATYGYRVDATHTQDPKIAKENLLGNEWKTDNFYYGELHNLAQKATEDYLTTYEFDVNDDGQTDFEEEEFFYDLRFKHLRRDAVIWLRTMPISDDLKGKDLRVLVQRYVDEVSGAGFEAVKLGPTTTIIREKRFAAHVVDRGPFKLAEQESYQTTFDVANVDELAINPNARRTRVRIVLVRTPFEYVATSRYSPDAKTHKYAVLMLAGYANLPEDFATDEKDFQQLLEHTIIDGKRGTTAVALESSPTPAAPITKAAAAPAGPVETTPPVEPTEPTAPVAPTAPPAAAEPGD